MNERFKKGPYLLYIILSAGVFLLLTLNFGLGVEFDAVHFLYTAQNFPERFVKPNQEFFIDWPPLYPVVLSLYKIFPDGILAFTKYLHLFLLVISGLFGLRFLSNYIFDEKFLYLASIAFAFSYPLLLVHIFAWSEPLFITFLVLIMFSLNKLHFTHSNKYFPFLILLIFLLIMQRKSGIMFIPGIALLLILNPGTISRRLFHSGTAAFAGVMSYALWQYFRKRYTGEMFGEAYWELERLLLNPWDTIKQISTWFLPDEIPVILRLGLLGSSLAICFIALPVRTILNEFRENSPLRISLFMTGSYLIVLNLILVYVHIADDFDDRILSPVYLPMFIMFFSLFYMIYKKRNELNFNINKLAVLLIISVWLLYPIIRTTNHIYHLNNNGTGGYNHTSWIQAPLIQKIKDTNQEKPVVSSENYALIYLLNLKETQNREILFTIPKRPFYYLDFYNNSFLRPEVVEKINKLPSEIIFANESGRILLVTP